MANADAPRGFRPVNALGHVTTGQLNLYYKDVLDGQALFVGDAVTTTGTAHTDEHSTPIVEQADADNPIRGIFMGVRKENPDSPGTIHSPALTADFVWILDDPYQLFIIQEDSDGGALAITDTGLNIDLIPGTGSAVTGLSAMEIDSDASKGTASAQLRLLRIAPIINNALGTNAQWIVMLNEHELKSTTGL